MTFKTGRNWVYNWNKKDKIKSRDSNLDKIVVRFDKNTVKCFPKGTSAKVIEEKKQNYLNSKK